MRKLNKKYLSVLLMFAIACTMCITNDDTTAQAATKKTTKITLNYKNTTMSVGDTLTLKVKAVKPAKSSKKVTWTSSNKKIAVVNSKGKVSAKKSGTVTITAKSKSNPKVTVKCMIKVYKVTKTLKLTSKKSYTLNAGETLKLTAKVTSPKTGAAPITWITKDNKIAKVTAKGKVTAVSSGTTTITGKSGKKKVMVKITVRPKTSTTTDSNDSTTMDPKPDNTSATKWGFSLSGWTNTITTKVEENGNRAKRDADGNHIYTTRFLSNGSVNWANDVVFDVKDVTPNAYREMYDAMGIESGDISLTTKTVTSWYYNYPHDIMEPLDDSEDTPVIQTETATVDQNLTIHAKMGTRVIKITAKRAGVILDTIYLTASNHTASSYYDYAPQDLELYAAVRHKIEDALWTDDMTTPEKLGAIADYINQTTHYPFTDTVTKEYNPAFWENWSIDDKMLYYDIGNDPILNRTMDLQGGIVTCQAASIIERVATEDLELPYLYDSVSDTVLDGEGVWIGMGSYSTNPYAPNHQTLWYKDAEEIKYPIDAQGAEYSHESGKASCEEHGCREHLISLK
ncbi:MAG: Ig-like domain-containing protein [Lachnospiraceae bacterium]|nr:Ig-like domain-containing protein [Lachnospiraceae bacterium]